MSQHWYCAKTGEPRYTTIGKNGKERNTTLRDARTENLVPSVSTINGLLSKAGLDTWKQTEVLYASVEYPRLDGEDEKTWIDRLLYLSKQKSREAAERGNLIHKVIESHYNLDYLPEWPAYVYAVEDALNKHFGPQLWTPEKSFAHPLGFGGRVDLSCRSDAVKGFSGIVVDIKSKEGPLESVVPYHENIMQLAAYREGLLTPAARCANIYVNGTTNEVRIVEHDEQDLRDAYECFQSLLRFYQIKNKL